MRPRSVGRRLALQYLFMADMNRYAEVENPADFFKNQRAAARDNEQADPADAGFVFDRDDPHQDEAEAFAHTLIREVQKNRDVIDTAIGNAAKNWTVARMGTIERNVLRIVAAEFRLGTSPKAVAVDEAVELAKRFGDKDSGAFVNGIADRLGGAGAK